MPRGSLLTRERSLARIQVSPPDLLPGRQSGMKCRAEKRTPRVTPTPVSPSDDCQVDMKHGATTMNRSASEQLRHAFFGDSKARRVRREGHLGRVRHNIAAVANRGLCRFGLEIRTLDAAPRFTLAQALSRSRARGVEVATIIDVDRRWRV